MAGYICANECVGFCLDFTDSSQCCLRRCYQINAHSQQDYDGPIARAPAAGPADRPRYDAQQQGGAG
ncbi:hypothetical protein D3C77_443920 [compost metagenome]